MANEGVTKGEITVDGRGRTSLARVRSTEHSRYYAEELADGTIVLTPMISFTPAGLDEFLENPEKMGIRRTRLVRDRD